MPVDFRCENCGKLLNVEASPGGQVRCPHCHKQLTVPAALASFPRPHVPPNAAKPPANGQAPREPGGTQDQEPAPSDALMNAMATSMPWVISIFFHLGLFLIMVFMVMMVRFEAVVPSDIVVPDPVLGGTPGEAVNPGEGNPDLKAATLAKVEHRGYSRRESSITGGDSGRTSSNIELIGVGGGGGGVSGGGELAAFGVGGGGSGSGPPSNFFGTGGGNVYHICYVVDASGSMQATGAWDPVRMEMLKSIANLKPVQDFHVILFSEGEPVEFAPRRLVFATEQIKDAAREFLNNTRPQQLTDPVPALSRALDVMHLVSDKKGKMVFLLTDGEFPDNSKIEAVIKAKNADKGVCINTYLYGSQAPVAQAFMKKIADENAGKFKYISLDE